MEAESEMELESELENEMEAELEGEEETESELIRPVRRKCPFKKVSHLIKWLRTHYQSKVDVRIKYESYFRLAKKMTMKKVQILNLINKLKLAKYRINVHNKKLLFRMNMYKGKMATYDDLYAKHIKTLTTYLNKINWLNKKIMKLTSKAKIREIRWRRFKAAMISLMRAYLLNKRRYHEQKTEWDTEIKEIQDTHDALRNFKKLILGIKHQTIITRRKAKYWRHQHSVVFRQYNLNLHDLKKLKIRVKAYYHSLKVFVYKYKKYIRLYKRYVVYYKRCPVKICTSKGCKCLHQLVKLQISRKQRA
eukprot:TRINITY_DN31_c0_g2_i1.p1 TRINITY_DN31_c0_g2~~TRINITY_DN31_c0_g2_i1.p1  ORF type:complete len:324 (-),score=66.25 TRINITY_DN31_c0_g2_i1:25-942(-)